VFDIINTESEVRKMNKLGRYDALKLQDAIQTITEVYEYNYIPSSSLTKKMETVLSKLEHILDTELEVDLQREYKEYGRVR
jgi:hypothetical protein